MMSSRVGWLAVVLLTACTATVEEADQLSQAVGAADAGDEGGGGRSVGRRDGARA